MNFRFLIIKMVYNLQCCEIQSITDSHPFIELNFICNLTDGLQMSGNIVPKLVGVWGTKSAPCDVSSSSMKEQTALFTASTAVGKSLRSDSHATECHAQASGGPVPGQRCVDLRKNIFCQLRFFFRVLIETL